MGTRRQQAAPTGSRGFTLLELLVVLAIASIILSLVPGAFSAGMGRLQGQAAALDLGATLERARSRAIGRQQNVDLLLSADGYRLAHDKRATKLASPWRLALQGGVSAADLHPYPLQALEESEAEAARIRFYPSGASSGGEIVLSDGRRQFRVEVVWLTGQIKTSVNEGRDG